VGKLEMVRKGAFFLQCPVCYDLVVVGRGDTPIEGSFIGWVVYARQPVVGAVGPVIAEEAAVAVFVIGDEEAVCGDAFVADGIRMLRASRGWCLEDKVAAVLRVRDRLVVLGDGENGHSLSGAVPLGKVEIELGGVGAEKYGYDCGSTDVVAVVVEREGEVVMLDIDDGVV
jgi:hypothetical protein